MGSRWLLQAAALEASSFDPIETMLVAQMSVHTAA
jgi:hypothetical protein